MCRTSQGERVLTGAERDLFLEGLSTLWDAIEELDPEDESGTTGIGVFDDHPKSERVALLALVAQALIGQDEPCPELTAVTEGTVAAIFAHILQWIEMEIEFPLEDNDSDPEEEPFARPMRELVLTAAREAGLNCLRLRAKSGRNSLDRWSDLIDELLDLILWGDRDCLAAETFLDLDPDSGAALKETLGISENYSSAAPTRRPLKTAAPPCGASATGLKRGAQVPMVGRSRRADQSLLQVGAGRGLWAEWGKGRRRCVVEPRGVCPFQVPLVFVRPRKG